MKSSFVCRETGYDTVYSNRKSEAVVIGGSDKHQAVDR